MRLSLCNEVIRDMPFPDQCRWAKAAGWDGLEIAPFTLAEDPEALTPREIADVKAALSDAGIVCSGLHWLLVKPDGLSITSDSIGVRARTTDFLRRLVDLCAELSGPVLVHGSPKQRTIPDGPDAEAARARGIGCIRAAAEHAEKAGVTYCLEPLSRDQTGFVNTVAEAARIVEESGIPALRTMVDCSSAAIEEGDVAALLDTWLPTGLVAHIQVNDRNRRGPGEGDMKFLPILAALRRNGYAGWVAAEPFVYEPDGPACAARSAGYLRGLIEALDGA